MVGGVAFLSYYLSLDYMTSAAQRDWHAALARGARHSSCSRPHGARHAGAGGLRGGDVAWRICFRPHAAVFLPAVASSSWARSAGAGASGGSRPGHGSFLFTTMRLAPPAGGERDPAGLRGRRSGTTTARDRGRGACTPPRSGRQRAQASSTPSACVVVRDRRLPCSPSRIGAATWRAAVWLAALGLALLYEPISPEVPLVPEDTALNLVLAVNVAMLTHLLLAARRTTAIVPSSSRSCSCWAWRAGSRPEFCALRPSLKAAAYGRGPATS